jgi:amino acid adenylation domain-containing protein
VIPLSPTMPSSAQASGIVTAVNSRPLHELLDEKARLTPDSIAYRFLKDGVSDEQVQTYADLAKRSRILASGLIERKATGKPVLLIEAPGPGFIEALFACWHSGAIAVPAYPPRGSRHRQRLNAILADSGATIALGSSGSPSIAGIDFLESSALLARGEYYDGPAVRADGPCLLQYTSGSTAAPKGVMISHENFRSHFSALRVYDNLELRSALSWLPPYHDMGLVLKILYAFEAGIPLTHFSPEHFVQRPVRWLQAISRYRAEMSGGPNFAYEACIKSARDEDLEGVDLSCWKAAACGAERIRPDTIERFVERFGPYGFRREAFFPGYGLAETTLIVTACHSGSPYRISQHPTAGSLVSNGSPLPGVDLRIVDPNTGESLESGQIGEIRIKSEVVSSGYWKRPLETRVAFSADGELHTGDLGYLEGGELFVTGRLKDLIIIDGVNVSPEDIEGSVMSAFSEISSTAAFASDANGFESICLALETNPEQSLDHGQLAKRIRKAVADALEVSIQRIVFVRTGLLPRTTSGKIRRSACREALSEGTLRIAFDDHAVSSQSLSLEVILEAVREIIGRAEISADEDIVQLGMGSLDVTRLSALLLSRTGVEVTVSELFAAESFRNLAGAVANRAASVAARPQIVPDASVSHRLLSHAQERMWFLHQLDPESAAYHVFGALEINGRLSREKLSASFQGVVSRHGILRSRHACEDGNAKIWIDSGDVPTMELGEIMDLTDLRKRLADFARKPFQLATAPPIRATLLSLDENRHFFAVCVHHIVADGWSLGLLARELASHYAGLAIAERPSLTAYQDFASAHREWIDSGAIDAQIAYWKQQLSGHPGILNLPTDFPRPHKPSSHGGQVVRVLSPEICLAISGLARSHRATPFMVQLSVFLLMLRQHGAGSDLVIAIPVANRNHTSTSDLVGTLVNTLPLRMQLRTDDTFSSLLDRIRTVSIEMQENQDAPFEKIIEAMRPDRSGDQSPLAQVMFDHQEIPLMEAWPDGVTCKPCIAHRGAAQFDLSLLLTIVGDQQQLAIEYRADLFHEHTAEAMLDRYLAMMARVCQDPKGSIRDTIIPAATDQETLAKVTRGPDRPQFLKQSAIHLIAARYRLHPQRHAVRADGGSLTYQKLAERSDRLAAALIEHGVRPGDRTAVLIERDLDLPVILLAIWKTGAAYVPLDRANPKDRLQAILDDQSPLLLLVSPGLTDLVPQGMDYLTLQEIHFNHPVTKELPLAVPDAPAYIIYTSGSTGKPKGVVVSHEALANFLLSMAETPGFTEADRLLAVTTISFDISLLEIFLPLVTGGTVEIVTTAIARDGHALLERLKSSAATVMQATPATWRLLIDAGWKGSPDLKILCGGEALDPELASTLVNMGCQLWNLYGPTETTVWSTCWRVPSSPDRIRIGTPIANTGIHILAEDRIPVPPGVPATLWISGAGLARGYWNQLELTADRFAMIRTTDGEELTAYNTGDLARWHPDGNLECLGRSDGQVKIRGFRVELGEIEIALSSHPQVLQAKAALREKSGRLVAWFTTAPDQAAPSAETLRAFLATKLPPYMIPADLGKIDAFPLGSSGKVDISRLADPESTVPELGPLSTTEARLIAIWTDLLDRPTIHPDDNWFHLGGHSLLALRLFARIHQDFAKRLPLSAILDQPTCRGLARLIDRAT